MKIPRRDLQHLTVADLCQYLMENFSSDDEVMINHYDWNGEPELEPLRPVDLQWDKRQKHVLIDYRVPLKNDEIVEED